MKCRHIATGAAAAIGVMAGLCIVVWYDGVDAPLEAHKAPPPAAHSRPSLVDEPQQRSADRQVASGPAPEATLTSRLPKLEAEADARNLAAATEVFRATAMCVHVQMARELQPQTVALLTEDTSSLGPADLEERIRLLSIGLQELEMIRKYSDDCQGFATDAVESGFMHRVTLRAANLGDARASECYVSGDFQPTEFLGTEDAQNEYRNNLLRFADEGVERGSPLSAYLLMAFYGAGGLTPLQRAGSRDVLKAYVYSRLLQYIVQGGSGQEQMTGMAEAYRTEAAGLDIGSAEAEAKQLFQRYYGHPIDFDVNPSSPCG